MASENESCLIDPHRDCLGLARARVIEQNMAEYERRNAATHERMFERLQELEKHEAVRDEQYRNIMATLNTVATDVSLIKQQPGKKWENLTGSLLSYLITALIAFALAYIGLSK